MVLLRFIILQAAPAPPCMCSSINLGMGERSWRPYLDSALVETSFRDAYQPVSFGAPLMRGARKKIKQQLLSEMNNKRKAAPVDKARQRMMEIPGDVPDKKAH